MKKMFILPLFVFGFLSAMQQESTQTNVRFGNYFEMLNRGIDPKVIAIIQQENAAIVWKNHKQRKQPSAATRAVSNLLKKITHQKYKPNSTSKRTAKPELNQKKLAREAQIKRNKNNINKTSGSKVRRTLFQEKE